jgi:hypothetical protein
MKIGFSILSHKNPDSVFAELINQLSNYPNSEIVIHHDFTKASFDHAIIQKDHIELVEKHIPTEWSHVNNIEAILKTFESLYDKDCDWFITLSANCYPIKSQKQIIDFLQNSIFDGYIEGNSIYSDVFDFYTYFRKAFNTKLLFHIPFLRKNGVFYWKALRTKRKTSDIIFDKSFIPYHGSDWFMINRTSMTYILKHKDKIDDIVSFLRKVNRGDDLNVCPAEVVFQTLLYNQSKLKLSSNNYRYIDWTNPVNWHPKVLTQNDFERIKHSDALFARKVDSIHSKDLIEEINKQLLS